METQQVKWEENQQALERERAEQNRKWWENQQEIRRMIRSIQALSCEHDSAVKGILEDWFNVQVIRVLEYDESGEVFGRPDQVELDLIVKDGLLILSEIKSSMSKADMVIFGRKASFYEKKHHCRASRLLVISPMVDKQAKVLADELGIQVYSYAEDVDPEVLTPKPVDSS